jgi:hypothetical protein
LKVRGFLREHRRTSPPITEALSRRALDHDRRAFRGLDAERRAIRVAEIEFM